MRVMPDTPGQNPHVASAMTQTPDSSPATHDSGKWYGDDFEADEDPLVGSILSNTYEVRRILGEGGMGRVYEAQHTRIASKRFAIKALHPEYARRKEVLMRFQREVEAAASIHSPHVVGVFDVDQTEDGQPFLVSELLEGKELGDYLEERGPIPVPFAVNIVRQICKALTAAHEKNIIHRDMKPENVFLCGDLHDPVAKVLDFGISRLEGESGNTLTKTGIIMGTPSYMAPEQAKGLRVDQRVDVYSVGAILYQAVTGKIPFDRPDATATLAAVLTEDPERPRAIMPTLPESFEMIIQRAMAREPEDRYQSMAELDAALAPHDEREMLSLPDKSSRMSAVKVPQSSMVDASDHARQIADARPQLLLYFGLGAGMLLFSLFTAIGGSLRLFRDDQLPTLTGLEAGIVAAVLIAALATPAFLIFRNLLRSTWSNTARVLEALRLVRDPVLAGLGGYGLVAISLRMLETFVLRTQIGIAWPLWDVLLPVAGLVCALTAYFVRRGSGLKVLGTTALVSIGATLAIVVIVTGAVMRSEVDIADSQDEEASRRPSRTSKADTSKEEKPSAPVAPAPPAPGAPSLPTYATALEAWEAVAKHMQIGHWDNAIDSLEVFVKMDPDGPKDHNVKTGVNDLAVKACVDKTAGRCKRIMALLSERMGEGGVDILFELVVTRGGTGATWHAAQLLQKPDVISRGSEALRMAHALRTANSCPKVKALLGDAAKVGDTRAIRELNIITSRGSQCRARGCCIIQSDPTVKSAIATIQARLAAP